MTATNQDDARAEALTRVIERVNAWQETATEGTIHDELEKGLRQAGITLSDSEREDVVASITQGRPFDSNALGTETEGGPA